MSDISILKNITPDEAAKLRAAKFTAREQMWAIVDEKLEVGIDDIVQKTGITKDRLIELLEADALGEAENLGVSGRGRAQRFLGLALAWFRRHWLDAAVVGTVGALLFLIFHAVWGSRSGYSTQVVATASGGIPAFHAITKSEVALRLTRSTVGSLGKLDEVIGRYATVPISEGAVLRAEQLRSDAALMTDLSHRSLLQIPVKGGVLEANMKPPIRVSLLLSPRAGAQDARPAVLEDVVLLAIRRDGDSIWASVAVQPDRLAILSCELGSADIFVVHATL